MNYKSLYLSQTYNLDQLDIDHCLHIRELHVDHICVERYSKLVFLRSLTQSRP